MRDGRMHQTTVRFGPDLWEALEDECSRLGVSAAQYLREAALARLSYTAGRRGDAEYAEAYSQVESALVEGAGQAVAERADPAHAGAAIAEAGSSTASHSANAQAAQADAAEQHETSSAVTAQSELVWRRSRALRGQAAELRREGRLRLE
jgi:hypothetical protein